MDFHLSQIAGQDSWEEFGLDCVLTASEVDQLSALTDTEDVASQVRTLSLDQDETLQLESEEQVGYGDSSEVDGAQDTTEPIHEDASRSDGSVPKAATREVISEMEILHTNKGKPMLMENGYCYHLNKKNKDIHYWSCIKKRVKQQENRCQATIQTRLENAAHVLGHASNHNHPPNPLHVQCRKLRSELKRRSVSRCEPPITTIRECAKDVPNEVQTMVSKPAQRKICQRSRQPAKYPAEPTPGNYDDIPEQYKKTLDGADFLLSTSDSVLLFTTIDNLRRLSTAKIWMLDGTFATAPPGFKQIYSIMGCIGSEDTARYLPFVFMLLTNKSEETYTCALEELVKIAETFGVELDPELALTDFERAAINAIGNVFPDCKRQGCFFHLTQNFFKRIQNCGLLGVYSKNESIFMNFKKIEALAFVPLEHVEKAFEMIAASAPPELEQFISYVEENYVLGRVRKRKNDGSLVRSAPTFTTDLWNGIIVDMVDALEQFQNGSGTQTTGDGVAVVDEQEDEQEERMYVRNWPSEDELDWIHRLEARLGGQLEGKLNPVPKSPVPFQTLHLDHVGPFPSFTNGNVHAEAPSRSEAWSGHRGRTAKWNEQIAVRTMLQDNHRKWDMNLPVVQWAINSTPNTTTGVSPSQLVLTNKPRDFVRNEIVLPIYGESDNRVENIDELKLRANDNIRTKEKQQKGYYDARRREAKKYMLGDMVLAEKAN
ncbi:uncharacterized protein LOC134223025 [Armigeres subalbatus]|uniref:uncharacterized protein LOC134223025 n=1 Tax=Armigeres subalbatus TaxID=124917 RepID=UPI002ED20CA4